MSWLDIENRTQFLEVHENPTFIGESPVATVTLYRTDDYDWMFSSLDGHLSMVTRIKDGKIVFMCDCIQQGLLLTPLIKGLIKRELRKMEKEEE
jgi:hypothetical protein